MIPLTAPSCPECGEVFEVGYDEVPEEPAEAPADEPMEASTEEAAETPLDEAPEPMAEPAVDDGWSDEELTADDEAYLDEPAPATGYEDEPLPEDAIEEPMSLDEFEKKPAKLFWAGIVMIAFGFFGGPIFSYLHDVLQIPVGSFTHFRSYGPYNWMTSIIGSIILAIGILLLLVGWHKIKKWRETLEAPLEEPDYEDEPEFEGDEFEEVEGTGAPPVDEEPAPEEFGEEPLSEDEDFDDLKLEELK